MTLELYEVFSRAFMPTPLDLRQYAGDQPLFVPKYTLSHEHQTSQ
jgi:hypothetical protein